MTVDKETLELIERRLAESVEARVRSKLFKYYGSVGAVALTILGFFSYSIVSGLEGLAEDYARKAAAPAVAAAEEATESTRRKTTELLVRLNAFEELQIERVKQLNASEREILEARAALSAFSNEIEDTIGTIRDDIKNTEAQLTAQGARFEGQEVAGLDYVATVEKNLATLAEQVALLEEQLSEMRQKTQAGLGLTYEAAGLDVAQLSLLAEAKSPDLPAFTSGVEGTRVFFQFAGVAREVAEKISAEMKAQNFDFPGEERHKAAAGLHEVRFFHEDDALSAETLATDLNLALQKMGYKDNVTVRDFSDYRGAKTALGTIELWLEPVPTR